MTADEEYYEGEEFQQTLTTYLDAMRADELPSELDEEQLLDVVDYYALSDDEECADIAMGTLAKLYPESEEPKLYDARHAICDDDLKKARKLLDSIDDKMLPEYIYTMADLLIAEGKTKEMQDMLDSYSKQLDDDDFEDFLIDIGSLLLDNNQTDEAEYWLNQVEDKEDRDYKELMALLLFQRQHYKESAEAYNSLLDDHPYSHRYWTALAGSQLMAGKADEAVDSSDFAIAIDPDNAQAMLLKADALHQGKQIEQALEMYRKVLAQYPEDEYCLLNVGLCLKDMGDMKGCIKTLEKAKAVAPKDSMHLQDISYHLAVAYVANNQALKALRLLGEIGKTQVNG